ncbi:MAG: ImmA/IrrE family metallo-endopeptidase [Acidobacteria bacterium]|nr:ImmA/IrrE family metallo-endopeptidase [Acidobacteriota bacterium]
MNRITHEIIAALVQEVGAATPTDAVRTKARAAVRSFCEFFGEPEIPFDVAALASFLGIKCSNEAPIHSQDAELVPAGDGRVAIRVNPERPETRRRFSMAHEISHTFFPHYQSKVWCRTDARFRRRENPDDHLEMLCDTGASEIVLPVPWFVHDAEGVHTGMEFIELTRKYGVSREATLRRYAEVSDRNIQAAYFSWRLKPAQTKRLADPNQQRLFDIPADKPPAKKLRLDYAIPSAAANGAFLPQHKSVDNDGPLYAAALGTPCEGTCHLDLGPSEGTYRVIAIPLWTSDSEVGPGGENSVGAIIEPIDSKPAKRKIPAARPSLF